MRAKGCEPANNRGQHCIRLGQRFSITEPQDREAELQQRLGSDVIRASSTRFKVLPTVQLHNQPSFHAGEIGEVGPDRMLSTELPSNELAVAKTLPDRTLRIG